MSHPLWYIRHMMMNDMNELNTKLAPYAEIEFDGASWFSVWNNVTGMLAGEFGNPEEAVSLATTLHQRYAEMEKLYR